MLNNTLGKWVTGAALSISAVVLVPIMKDAMRPLVKRTNSYLQMMREEVEDIIAEAQFERLKRQIDGEIANTDLR